MAGEDPRGTGPRIVELREALVTPSEVDVVVLPQFDKKGDSVILTVIGLRLVLLPIAFQSLQIHLGAAIANSLAAGRPPGVSRQRSSGVGPRRHRPRQSPSHRSGRA